MKKKVCNLHHFMTRIKKYTFRTRIECAFKISLLMVSLGSWVDGILAYCFSLFTEFSVRTYNIYKGGRERRQVRFLKFILFILCQKYLVLQPFTQADSLTSGEKKTKTVRIYHPHFTSYLSLLLINPYTEQKSH